MIQIESNKNNHLVYQRSQQCIKSACTLPARDVVYHQNNVLQFAIWLEWKSDNTLNVCKAGLL